MPIFRFLSLGGLEWDSLKIINFYQNVISVIFPSKFVYFLNHLQWEPVIQITECD